MPRYFNTCAITLCGIILSTSGHGDPWFTGPILAPAGHTVSRGHTNYETYALDVFGYGHYDSSGRVIRTPLNKSFIVNPIITHGFTDALDVQFAMPYNFNSTRSIHYNRVADSSIAFGYQVMEQKDSVFHPNLRILLQEVFPTGKFDNLHPAFLGTDATGLGSYQTQIGLNFQYLTELANHHYLRTRLIVSYLYTNPVTIYGFSVYGGAFNTVGKISGVNEDDFDLAFEYTLTQHWVAVMEGTFSSGGSTRFRGFSGTTDQGLPALIGAGSFNEIAFAPAMEYNFTANIGLIGGVWFTASGRNTAYYRNYVLALNAFW